MTFFVTFVHVLVCILLIIVVLLQRGKGAEIGAVFGGGAGSTLFGSRGAGTFLSKLTSVGAGVFMLTSFYLAYIAVSTDTRNVLDQEESAAPVTTPAEGAPAAATPAGGDFVEVPAEPKAETPAPSGEDPAPAVSPDAPAAESSGDAKNPGSPTQ
jgi:preprotein translocase subunit SecG